MATPSRAASGAAASTTGRHEALTEVQAAFPCRDAAIAALAAELCGSSEARPPCFVWGPPATGKTAVVRWGCRHAAPACPPVQPPQASAVATPHFSQH